MLIASCTVYTEKMSLNCLRSMLSILLLQKKKLIELAELKALSECDYNNEAVFQSNAALFENRPDCCDPAVQERVSKIGEKKILQGFLNLLSEKKYRKRI